MNFRYFPTAELAAAVLAGCTSFIEVHVWEPAYTYFLLLFLVTVDSILRNKLKRRPTRPGQLLVVLAAYTLVLAFAHGFGGHEIGLRWLPQVVLAPLVIFHLRRFIVNLGKVDLMDEDVSTLLNLKILRRAELAEAEAAATSESAELAPAPEGVSELQLEPAPAPEATTLQPV
jgi:hypothetical protein